MDFICELSENIMINLRGFGTHACKGGLRIFGLKWLKQERNTIWNMLPLYIIAEKVQIRTVHEIQCIPCTEVVVIVYGDLPYYGHRRMCG